MNHDAAGVAKQIIVVAYVAKTSTSRCCKVSVESLKRLLHGRERSFNGSSFDQLGLNEWLSYRSAETVSVAYGFAAF
jgi:hypothetical protein